MLDNSQDKGYTGIQLRKREDGFQLSEMSFGDDTDLISFYADYENGSIYIDWKDGSPKQVIGYYETTIDDVYLAKVYDNTKSHVIGRVGKELIYFRRRDADPSSGRYSPEEECLAYYTKNGNITALGALPYLGFFNGSEIGGAAAFVAIFFAFNFKGVFLDYFEMENERFKEVYARYLNPLGL